MISESDRNSKGETSNSLLYLPLLLLCGFLLVVSIGLAGRLYLLEMAWRNRTLDVVLPDVGEAIPLTAKPKEIFVTVDEQGQYFIENRMLTENEVDALLQQATLQDPINQSVIIRADKRVPFDFVVKVMNLCNRAKMEYVVTTEGKNQ